MRFLPACPQRTARRLHASSHLRLDSLSGSRVGARRAGILKPTADSRPRAAFETFQFLLTSARRYASL